MSRDVTKTYRRPGTAIGWIHGPPPPAQALLQGTDMPGPVARTPLTKTTPPPADNVALGDLAGRLDAADQSIAKLQDQLRRIDEALANPAHADKRTALLQLKAQLGAQLKAELPKRDALKKTFDAAVATSGSARDGVSATYARLQNVEAELAAAKARLGPLSRAISAKVTEAEAEAKKHRSGLLHPAAAKLAAQAEKLGKQLEALEANIASLQKAKSALTRELEQREPKALAEAKQSPDAAVREAARNQSDVADLASTTRDQQVKVIGAPVVGVSAQKAVEVDVGRISTALKNAGATNAAQMLALQLDSATKPHQEALVKAAAPQIAAIAKQANGDGAVAEKLIDAMSKTHGLARYELSGQVAKSVTGMDSAVIKTLDAKMKNGEGLEEAYQLATALKKAGKPELAARLHVLVDTRVKELTDDFAKQSEKISGVKGDLGRLVAGFGPMLSGDKQQAALNAFKARHKAEFDAFEASGAKLARAASFISDKSRLYEKGYELLPEALSTQGGQQVVADAVRDLAKGKPTFLETSKDIGKLGKYAPQLVVKAMGQQALDLVAAGKPEAAKQVLDKLKAAGGVLTVDGKKLDDAVDALKKVVDGDQAAVKAFDTKLRSVKADAGTFNALKGLAWATSALAGLEHLGSDQLKTQVKGVTEILSPTGESIGWGLEAIAKAKAKAWTDAGLTVAKDGAALAKTFGGVASGIGAVLDGVSAAQSFMKGELLEGSGSTLSAIGGAVLAVDTLAAAAGMQVVPVWGQIAGAALVIGGTIIKGIAAERKAAKKEKAAEDDAQAYLEAAGIDRARADELSDLRRSDGRNVGMMIQQLAPAMGMKPAELWEKISRLPASKIDEFVDMTKDLVVGKDGKISPTVIDDNDKPYIKTVNDSGDPDGRVTHNVRRHPQSIPTAVEWTRRFLAE